MSQQSRFSPLEREAIKDMIRLFGCDFEEMKKQLEFFDIQPFTDALAMCVHNSWHMLAINLRAISDSWQQDLALLMELDGEVEGDRRSQT